MTITYWTNFSKRINSTKQPTGGTNITTVALKTPCSVETPVFILMVYQIALTILNGAVAITM